MTIVVLGDVHDHGRRLDSVLELIGDRTADLAILVGDLGLDPPWLDPARSTERRAHDESVRRVLARARQGLDCAVLFVPGNHDLADPPETDDGMNVDGRVVEIMGLRVAGFGGAGPARFGFPYEWTDDEAETVLSRLLAEQTRIDVLISHAPPARTKLDRIRRGERVGSAAVRRWIDRSRPRLFVCGHIHEAWGVEIVHGVPCVNAGALGEPYGQQIVWRIDWNDAPVRVESYRRLGSGRVQRDDWSTDLT